MAEHLRSVRRKAIQERREKVASMYLSARTQNEIAIQLEVTQATVSTDLKALQKQWQANALQSIDKIKAKELAAIDRLEREYWDSWLSSQQPKETTTSEQSSGGMAQRIKAAIRTERRDGDPRYLEGIRWCINKRCEIMGLNAAIKQLNLTRDVSAMSDAEIEDALRKYGYTH